MTAVAVDAPTIGRIGRFASVGSTNDVVREWLAAGEPEICVAVADAQTAGRGRNGRTWTAPAGAGLLLSLGFRPTWLPAEQVWRLAASVSLAMAESAEAVIGLPSGSIQLKWPNDLVVAGDVVRTGDGVAPPLEGSERLRKLGGVLGETDGLGSLQPIAIVGIGVNADWPGREFPSELAGSMTSLRELSGDGDVDTGRILSAFLARLTGRVAALHAGAFDADDWTARQVTTGREIDLTMPDGRRRRVVARGVDAESGALRVAGLRSEAEEALVVGEIRHVRLAAV